MKPRTPVAVHHTSLVGADHTGHNHGMGKKSDLVAAMSQAYQHCSVKLCEVNTDHLANGIHYHNTNTPQANHANGHSHSHPPHSHTAKFDGPTNGRGRGR